MKGAPRKLRKSCSLPTCSKTPGECMHCTCDGRCGQHDAGRCGVRREGNGKSCKREGCAKDATCLHSTRATCCHCRNLVSSSNRSSRKRTRADVELPVKPTALPIAVALNDDDEDDDEDDDDVFVHGMEASMLALNHAIKNEETHPTPADSAKATEITPKTGIATDVDGASSPTSCDGLLPLSADIFGDFDIGDDLMVVIKKQRTEPPVVQTTTQPEPTAATPTPVASTLLPKSLCEYEQYTSRRGACNLVVVVEGTQFNLHKHPMLLESQLLNAKARESLLTSQSPVPIVQLSSFPGGAEIFEALCVYAYSGELNFSATNAAALYCAVHYMNMGLTATTLARHYLTSITHQAGLVEPLLRVTQDASTLMDKHDSLSVCAELHLECVDALARMVPLELASVVKLMHFPIELFLQVTQEMLASRGPPELMGDMVRQLCVQAELAQFHRDAIEKTDDAAPQKCLVLLEQSLTTPTQSSNNATPSPVQGGLKGGSNGPSSATQDDEDDALFMKMMCDFEMDPSSDDEGSSGPFSDALSVAALEPFAFASRSQRGAFSAATFAV